MTVESNRVEITIGGLKMKRFYVLFTVLIVLALALGACTPAAPEAPMEEAAPMEEEAPAEEEAAPAEEEMEEEAPAEPEEMPMIVLVPAGRVGQEGFMYLAGVGYMEAVADFGFAESILESDVPEEWERNVRTAAQDGADLIVGVGSTMQDAVANVAPDFPDVKFALVDSYAGGDNVVGLISQEQEGTYLAGVLAASMTTSDLEGMNEGKVIGFIGGMDIPVIHRFLSGLEQGAAYVDPEVTIEVAYVGSFADPAKAKELALAMIENQGVDIVYSVAGSFGDAGVFEAVEEKGVYGIGSDVDWDSQVPGSVLTSVLKHTDKAVYDIIERYVNGEFEAGEIPYGVADGVMDITDMSVMGDKIPDDVRATLDDIKAKIKSGEIVIERPEN
jgi:basic membrane protein A and related proteins